MGSCIICGEAVDGTVCDSHEEDVVFEFRGTSPDQLTPSRFYRGTVDGYADFGVFVDIGESVTGLLHRSKLDQRLESLDWEAGDTVFVQVQGVRDNGDIDLGWSIRQDESEFRGMLIDDPEGDHEPDADDTEETGASRAVTTRTPDQSGGRGDDRERSEGTDERGDGGHTGAVRERQPTPDDGIESETGPEGEAAGEDGPEADTEQTTADAPETDHETETETTEEPSRVEIGTLEERVGETIRIEGEVVAARQTSGPTVFELRDETGTVDCAAFEEAGVRAYPEVETGDIVRLDGEMRTRRDELQVETEALVVLEDEEREAVTERMEAALVARAEPETVEPLVADPGVDAEDLGEVATVIRRAVLEARPVVVRHSATAGGYVAGAAIERAVLPLVREEHVESDAVYHYFDRRPLEDGVYDMDDATNDVTGMLDNRERHGEQLPLFVFAGAASMRDALDGLELLDVYGAERVVVDGVAVDDAVAETVGAVAAPDDDIGPVVGDELPVTASAVAANLAAVITDDDAVRDDLAHLPAVSYWGDTPEQYADLASDAGYDTGTVRQVREAIALEAYYQSYEDKRELVEDLLFETDETAGLAEQVSEQFRSKLEAELETARANLERRDADDMTVAVLDADAYTHRFDFPPTPLLLDELHRRVRDGPTLTVGVATDELLVRCTEPLDLQAIGEDAAERVPEAGLAARGARQGKFEFLAGERDAVLEAVIATAITRM